MLQWVIKTPHLCLQSVNGTEIVNNGPVCVWDHKGFREVSRRQGGHKVPSFLCGHHSKMQCKVQECLHTALMTHTASLCWGVCTYELLSASAADCAESYMHLTGELSDSKISMLLWHTAVSMCMCVVHAKH